MKLDKAIRRDSRKNKNKMVVNNKGIFILEEQKHKKAEKQKAINKKKQRRFEKDLEEGE